MTTWGTTATPPPGWYPDPGQPAFLRWWDGAMWTEYRAPGWQPSTGGVSNDLAWLLPVNRDGFAIASGYLGLLSLLPNPLTSTAAIVCGVVAMRRVSGSGKLGRGRAWFGVIVGGLSLAVFAFAIFAAH